MENNKNQFGAGGTPGGLLQFIVGAGLAMASCYLFTQSATVTSGYWQIAGYNVFGMPLFPLFFGLALLLFDGKSMLGWVLMLGAVFLMLFGITANLPSYLVATSLQNTVTIVGMLVVGLGLVIWSIKPR